MSLTEVRGDRTHRGALTPIISPIARRFSPPPAPPSFDLGPSLASIASLVVMTLLSAVMLRQLLDPDPANTLPILGTPDTTNALATWAWLPFAFTIFGAGVGAVFETYLVATGTPFQQMRSRGTTRVLKVRLLNLAPVAMTIFFFVVCFTIGDPSLKLGLAYLAAATAGAIGLALYFGGAESYLPLILLGAQGAQIVLVILSGSVPGGGAVRALLFAQAITQGAAFLVTTATPSRSTVFHVLSTVSGVLLYRALVEASNEASEFSHAIGVTFPWASMRQVGLVVAVLFGMWLVTRLSPLTYNNVRMVASNGVWSVIYFVLVSQGQFPKPFSLAKVYGDGPAPPPTALQPYASQHPRYMSPKLAIPAAEVIETNVEAFGALVAKAKKLFKVISPLDDGFPQANPAIPLSEKPRMEVWSSGEEYYPALFRKELFGLTIPGRTLEPTPEPAIEAFKAGQLLAYLTESGVAAALPRAGVFDGQPAIVLDLRHLEKYETKADYEPYGGQAFFRLDPGGAGLVLLAVVEPRTERAIAADPDDPMFRHAEAMVLASLYFDVICGKHLAEIHMTYNLVEVAMHNAFDAQGQWNHPFRAFMYLHLFSHELAEELTTEHLVQQGGIFSQIFATTYDSLIDSLNDRYRNFAYGDDEDFAARAALVTVPGATSPPAKAAITWELRYAEIFDRYATSLVHTIYPDDAAVQADPYLRDFHEQLLVVLPRGLPDRYDALRTRTGLIRYATDTIHHLVIRHQVYGTTGVKAAMDPRLSSTQVPRDGGTPGVDEWRSLICVALATARSRFTLLLDDYTYLLEGVDPALVPGMTSAFDQLQEDLRMLDVEWTTGAEARQFNYDYFRALPSELHTGPGY